MKGKWNFDPLLLWLSLALTVIGLLAIFDSGYARSAVDGMAIPREFRSQLLCSVGAVVVGLICWRIKRSNLKTIAIVFYAVVTILLVLVKLFGTEINGAKRWIFSIQPAEFAKLSVILVLASIFAIRQPRKKLSKKPIHWAERLDWVWVPRISRSWPLLFPLLAAGLVLIEPDLATAMVIVVVSGFIFVMGGVSKGSLISLGFICTLAVGVMIVKEPYRMDRILHHEERWGSENIEGIGYQTTQSEAAMANGGLLGVGLGDGRAKHTLPAPTTDFVMATIAEETGFLGTTIVMALMGGLVWRLLHLAQIAKDKFGKLILYGTGSWIGIQACTNIVMANGFAPPIGVPMPFISAGGSSLIALWMAIGVCQSVLKENSAEVEELETSRNRRWNRRPRISRA